MPCFNSARNGCRWRRYFGLRDLRIVGRRRRLVARNLPTRRWRAQTRRLDCCVMRCIGGRSEPRRWAQGDPQRRSRSNSHDRSHPAPSCPRTQERRDPFSLNPARLGVRRAHGGGSDPAGETPDFRAADRLLSAHRKYRQNFLAARATGEVFLPVRSFRHIEVVVGICSQ